MLTAIWHPESQSSHDWNVEDHHSIAKIDELLRSFVNQNVIK